MSAAHPEEWGSQIEAGLSEIVLLEWIETFVEAEADYVGVPALDCTHEWSHSTKRASLEKGHVFLLEIRDQLFQILQAASTACIV